MICFNNRSVLVCGASSGIGLSITTQLIKDKAPKKGFATFRQSSDLAALKLLQIQYPDILSLEPLEATIEEDYKTLSLGMTELDAVINCIGVLHDQHGLDPERKIEEFDIAQHLKVYTTNTVPSFLLAKHLKKQLRQSPQPVFVSLSAKVGSVSDNRMGGWHSYRVSKAALNMVIKNLSIEFGRFNQKSLFVGPHRGTTETELSRPFLSGAKKRYTVHSCDDTAGNLLQVIEQLEPGKDNGSFYSWNGEQIPW